MWEIEKPQPVKLITGILAADENCLALARDAFISEFGQADFISEAWEFSQTKYYLAELGEHPLRQFVSIAKLVDPGRLAAIKHRTNEMERELAPQAHTDLPRPINLDPGYIEPSKLVLASTKNFSHRIYIGQSMYAEITLGYRGGAWRNFEYTFPDYREDRYHGFLSQVRERLVEQLRELRAGGKS